MVATLSFNGRDVCTTPGAISYIGYISYVARPGQIGTLSSLQLADKDIQPTSVLAAAMIILPFFVLGLNSVTSPSSGARGLLAMTNTS